jgi:uncharacterized integral membrane protein
MTQNFKNHYRYVPMYHYVLLLLLVVVLAACTVNLVNGFYHRRHAHAPLILLVMSIILILVSVFVRTFPLKAQDRAIRAEENLRHFVLTGKLLDTRLRMSQIVALRFAADEEFPRLAAEAAEKNMDGKAIKMAIVNWRPDNHRV